LNAAAAKHQGFLGCGLLHPGGGDNVWNVVYRFDTTANLDSWERSVQAVGGLIVRIALVMCGSASA
jgi:antibiotic biosynthesis monooxygenase (ABM) superfamily enzyme